MFADDIILYIENCKYASRKLLELINEFRKVATCKIKAQRSLACLFFFSSSVPISFANSKRSEREIKETISFTIASKRVKYLGISLPKEAKDLTQKTVRY